MKAELKSRWVEALRSGDYDQGTGCLRLADRYCCLGVLCDVVDPGGWREPMSPDVPHEYAWGGHAERLSLSQRMSDNLGLARFLAGELAEMNDHRRMDFPRIADWIEANVLAE